MIFDLETMLNKLPAKINSSPALYFFIIATIVLFDGAINILLGKSHFKLYSYFVSFVSNRYSLDFILATLKSVLIVDAQIMLVLLCLKQYGIEARDIGWQAIVKFRMILVAVSVVIVYKMAFELIGHFYAYGDISSISFGLNPLWQKLHNPIAYHYLFTIPFVLPIFEELLFRGFVQTALEKKVGAWISILLTAILFTMWHTAEPKLVFNLNIFACAVIYGALRKLDGTLWPSIAAHCTHNFLISAFIYRVV